MARFQDSTMREHPSTIPGHHLNIHLNNSKHSTDSPSKINLNRRVEGSANVLDMEVYEKKVDSTRKTPRGVDVFRVSLLPISLTQRLAVPSSTQRPTDPRPPSLASTNLHSASEDSFAEFPSLSLDRRQR